MMRLDVPGRTPTRATDCEYRNPAAGGSRHDGGVAILRLCIATPSECHASGVIRVSAR